MPTPTYRAFASDFDGTLAHDGTVPEVALEGLRRLRASGWTTLLVTGRQLEELSLVFRHLDLFDCVVGENGGLLYWPASQTFQLLATAPPPKFVEALLARAVGPIAVGHTIVATWEPHQNAVLDTIHELHLELQVTFNKGAAMILPTGINKATGLHAALAHYQIDPADTVAVGDAENDHAFLQACGFPVAVANALPALKEHARLVTTCSHGEGVAECIDTLLGPAPIDPTAPLSSPANGSPHPVAP